MTVDANLTAAGYELWHEMSSYEAEIGPFYVRKDEGGGYQAAVIIHERHLGALGTAQTSFLMSFADSALFVIAKGLGAGGVTVSLTNEYSAPAGLGDRVEASGEVMRATRSLIFLKGRLFVGDRTVMTFTGIIKRALKPVDM